MGRSSPLSIATFPLPWRALIAFAAGGLTVLAFAPFSIWPLALVGPLLLVRLWRSTRPVVAFYSGWAYGIGLLGFGVFWLHISIDKFGNMGTPAAIGLTLLFVLVMALYYGAVGWLLQRCFNRSHESGYSLLLMPSLWVLGEWLRGWILGGFPWLLLGYSQIDAPLAGWAPLLGVYGISWVVMMSVVLLDRLPQPAQPRRLLLASWLTGIWLVGALLAQVHWTDPISEPRRVSMIQANIPQEEKWQRGNLQPTLALYTGYTRQHWDSDLVIWPETAIPAFLHQVQESLLQPLAAEARDSNTALLIGLPVWDGETGAYYNAMLSIGDGQSHYAKRHLVPFGEFMPLKRWLGPLLEWLEIPMSDFSAGTAKRPLLPVGGLQAGISICYEDAFGEEMIQALPEAAYLVNASNDAWFGDSLAPYQHLQIARMRALESGRYLLRATNTGISAIIAPDGKVEVQSPIFQRHVLSGRFVPMQGATPYVWVGNGLVISLSLLLVLALGWRNFRVG